MDFETKYFFISNIRTSDGEKEQVAAQMLTFDSQRTAEIKFYDEVAYGLKLNNLILAHYVVTDEFGSTVNNLFKIIDNTDHSNIATE